MSDHSFAARPRRRVAQDDVQAYKRYLVAALNHPTLPFAPALALAERLSAEQRSSADRWIERWARDRACADEAY